MKTLKSLPALPMIQAFAACNQSHVFRFWDELNQREQSRLLKQAETVNLDQLRKLQDHLQRGHTASTTLKDLRPAPFISPASQTLKTRSDYWDAGISALKAGKVAAATVAGGDGTRLGFDHPKGMFPICPISRKSFFQLFAENIRAVSEELHIQIPWLIMTNPNSEDRIRDFFQRHRNFGLTDVRFFNQGLFPSLDESGNLFLHSKFEIAMNPDGHGGFIEAIANSGNLHSLKSSGVELISYFQIDNPLVIPLDPEFIGIHLNEEAEASAKIVRRHDPEEKVGVFAIEPSGAIRVLEYVDADPSLFQARSPSTGLLYHAANTAIHLLDINFLIRIVHEKQNLPYHMVRRRVECIDENGLPIVPQVENAVKFEQFIFDAFPLAHRVSLVECERKEEFCPVKSAIGKDTAEIAHARILERGRNWIENSGGPAIRAEISPLVCWHPKLAGRLSRIVPRRETEEPIYIGPHQEDNEHGISFGIR